MKRFFQWVAIAWLPASVVFAQGPTAPETPLVDPAKSAVTVVFAPDYSSPSRRPRAGSATLRSVDTPPARILSAMTGGRINASAGATEFGAPMGLTGIRAGADSVMAVVVTIGEDGRPHYGCSRLPQALERLKSANTAVHSTGEDAGHD